MNLEPMAEPKTDVEAITYEWLGKPGVGSEYVEWTKDQRQNLHGNTFIRDWQEEARKKLWRNPQGKDVIILLLLTYIILYTEQ